MLLVLCVACVLLAACLAHADVPRIITFQGKLTDTAGNPLTGVYALTFRLYGSETGGTPPWQETHPNVAVTKGLFAVPLGVYTPLSLPFDTAYWVSVQVTGDEEMAPRQRLTSAPYALRAAEADAAATSPMDPIASEYRRNATVVPNDTGSVKVLEGTLAISNVPGEVRFRKNTAPTIVTWSALDQGSATPDTQYYVYAVADAAGTDFTFRISASDTAPSGTTYYRKIGYFYNDVSGNVRDVGNIRGGDAPNVIAATGTTDISTTSTSYVDMEDMEIRFVSAGRPVEIEFDAPLQQNGSAGVALAIVIDGSVRRTKVLALSHVNHSNDETMSWHGELAAGKHTAKIQWHTFTGTVEHRGTTKGTRLLRVQEH